MSAYTPLSPDARLGVVGLAVSDLARSTDFYAETLGMAALDHTPDRAVMGTADGTPLIALIAQPGAQPQPRFSTGLFHVAMLLPSRADLGAWLLHVARTGFALQGASDHFVSEAIYLADPDGNGIEVYRDRPRVEWTYQGGELNIGTVALDLDGVLNAGRDQTWEGIPSGTTIGHVHLRVSEIESAVRFYRDGIGLDVMMRAPGAVFMAAGGYHHHLGANIWGSRGAPPPPADSVGLRWFTLITPDAAQIEARLNALGYPVSWQDGAIIAVDPSDNTLRITA